MTNTSNDPSPPASGSIPDDFMCQYHEPQMMMSQMLLSQNISPQIQTPTAVAPQSIFVPLPPFTSINSEPSPGKSSLYHHFPTIKASMLLDIAHHEFKPKDLFKLDSHFRERGDPDKGEDSKSHAGLPKEYLSLSSLLTPLLTYFRVLENFAASAGDLEATCVIADGTAIYMAHILVLHQQYQWGAVLQYHFDFHYLRRPEMRDGDYSGWARTDAELMNRHLFGHFKVASEGDSGSSASTSKTRAEQVCFAFNKGECTTSPCPGGCVHKCRKCSAMGHGEKDCKKT
ncbi:hypothetical protein K443DRAFT_664847 [Laccaria amethystina LaAM-08-1]|uniref:CCHC-type domain-containing protein n=1 Tax=Laccaria amethystina LaAM-08-1 TaxID=1095629 RepID=A0A0C9XXF3_9AGAR|nr:hypothetical protein K443DRAFT_664847 [Laccaria amethystina LaAM-08-1]